MGGSSESQMPEMDQGIQSSSPESIPNEISRYEADMYNSNPTEDDLTKSAHDAAGTETTNPEDPRSEEYKKRKRMEEMNSIRAYFSAMPQMTMPSSQSMPMSRPSSNLAGSGGGMEFNAGKQWNIRSNGTELLAQGIQQAGSAIGNAFTTQGKKVK